MVQHLNLTLKSFVSKLVFYHETLDRAFSSHMSVTTVEIVLQVVEAHSSGRELTIKELCSGSRKTILSVRKKLAYLVDDGWLEIRSGNKDRRQKIITPQSKLMDLLKQMMAEENLNKN